MDYQPMILAENRELVPGTFVLTFRGGEFLARARPGQFVMVRGLDWGLDPLLPRAFSLLEVAPGGEVGLLVKTTGKASRLLERSKPGAHFSLLGPLGRGFPEPSRDRQDWLVAGGVGLAPLLMYARAATEAGLRGQITAFYGGRSARDLVLLDELTAASGRVELATEDGSRGARGRVTAPLEQALSALDRTEAPPTLFACGPEPMLEAVARIAHKAGVPAYLSLEGEMACGVGACLVCAVRCHGPRPFRYACTDGPVFDLADLAGRYDGAVR